ncbi:hypothetical protein [Modestobacter altitudinis]|uniref:hypothetical protein n=1 Tax=Modestobacter altitudinis TaxID=2213158 RepID=UPI00110D0285|nr:hypothetical protein [Modestobacter altitudinis]
MAGCPADARAAAVADALAPCPWREFTDRMLARRVVAAVDRHDLTVFVAGEPGADVGDFGPVDPADPGDGRVEAVVRALDQRRWRGSSLDRLCAELVASLESWQTARDSFDEEDLRRLLEGR